MNVEPSLMKLCQEKRKRITTENMIERICKKMVNCKIKCTFVNFEERQSAFSFTKVFSWIIMASFCEFTITKGL